MTNIVAVCIFCLLKPCLIIILSILNTNSQCWQLSGLVLLVYHQNFTSVMMSDKDYLNTQDNQALCYNNNTL